MHQVHRAESSMKAEGKKKGGKSLFPFVPFIYKGKQKGDVVWVFFFFPPRCSADTLEIKKSK